MSVGDKSPAYGELRVRVENVEHDISIIGSQVNTIRDTMATRADITSIIRQLETMSMTAAALAKPNYGLMVSVAGVVMVFLTMIGGFAYWPIAATQTDLKSAVISITHDSVSQKQYDQEWQSSRADRLLIHEELLKNIQQQRYNADMAKIEARLLDIEKNAMTKDEFALIANERARSLAEIIARILRLEELATRK
jgi:hypothetical protein